MMMDRVHVEPGAVGGAVRIPSSKSIGHRAIICAGDVYKRQDLYQELESRYKK